MVEEPVTLIFTGNLSAGLCDVCMLVDQSDREGAGSLRGCLQRVKQTDPELFILLDSM